MSQHLTFAYAALALIAGIGIPVMAALNGGLGARLGSPVAAALVLFLVGLAATSLVLLISGLPTRPNLQAMPLPYFLGGLLVAFYVLAITWLVPRFGVGNAVFFVLLGQIMSAALIDHFGLFGVQQQSLNLQRWAGIVLMASGVFLARKV